MLNSALFQGDPILKAIAADEARISTVQNAAGEAVTKVQTVLLVWDPSCLPVHGADGGYGDETARAVHRFKLEELGVSEAEVIDDIGPRTVIRLDEIQLGQETPVPHTPSVRVRRDIWKLQPKGTPWHPTVLAYALGVGELKKELASDPRSWRWSYQTEVHGMAANPNDGLRHQCQHRSWYFLPWHRLYVQFFERIVRAAINRVPGISDEVKRDWALPYWDYDQAGTRTLPPAFREALLPNQDPNPLFEAVRNNGINAGTLALQAAEVRALGWFRSRPFSSATGGATFGGGVTGWNHWNESPGFATGSLEITPHGDVHVRVGGLMAGFATAAADPIFWLHHANIDRLWEIWRRNTGAGLDTTDQAWLGHSFDFLDETGAVATFPKRPADALDIQAQLGYTYEDMSVPPSAGLPIGGGLIPDDQGEQLAGRPPERLGAFDDVLRLADGETRTLSIELDDLAARVAGLELAAPPRLLLTVEHIRCEGTPNVSYGVYLDPSGAEGNSILIGTLPLFGLLESADDEEHQLSYSFDITEFVEELRAVDQWDPLRATLSFRPINEPAVELARQDGELGSVSIGSVSLSFQ